MRLLMVSDLLASPTLMLMLPKQRIERMIHRRGLDRTLLFSSFSILRAPRLVGGSSNVMFLLASS